MSVSSQNLLCIGGPKAGKRITVSGQYVRTEVYGEEGATSFVYVRQMIDTPAGSLWFLVPYSQEPYDTMQLLLQTYEAAHA